jgi:hypothetical protein
LRPPEQGGLVFDDEDAAARQTVAPFSAGWAGRSWAFPTTTGRDRIFVLTYWQRRLCIQSPKTENCLSFVIATGSGVLQAVSSSHLAL